MENMLPSQYETFFSQGKNTESVFTRRKREKNLEGCVYQLAESPL